MKNCKSENCKKSAIFDSLFCWLHIEDGQAYKKRLEKLVEKGTSFKEVDLSGVDLSNMDLARVDFCGANLSRANLFGASLFDADLKNAELLGADLSNADLTSANLEHADLTRASLQGARLWHSNLENANLIEANLNRCDLWNAKLFNVRLWRTELSQAISLSKNNFLHKPTAFFAAYRINERGVFSAEDSYRDLKKYFLSTGRYNDASWASYREKTMERLMLKKKKDLAYLPSLAMDFLCGYGEKPYQIIFSSFFLILSYGLLYKTLNAVLYTPFAKYAMSFSDYLYYSVITFTTVGYGDFIPKSSILFRAIASSEAFIGTFMIGLFVFTLARKYSAR